MTNEYKTLRELDVQPGDVVVNNLHGARPVAVDRIEGGDFWSKSMRMSRAPIWRIISRASDTPKTWGDGGMKLEEGKYYRTADGKKVGPLAGASFKWIEGMEEPNDPEWQNDGKGVDGTPDIVAEWTEEPKLWRDMTPEEKGALLLAHHEGKVIQCLHEGEWVNIYKAPWVGGVAYRVKPEEKRKTFHMYGHDKYFGFYQRPFHTHRITFNLIDGKPDCDSIKMEEL